jgi:hypothetical protein
MTDSAKTAGPPRGFVEAFDLTCAKIHIRMDQIVMVESFNEGVVDHPCVRVFIQGLSDSIELQGSIDGVDGELWRSSNLCEAISDDAISKLAGEIVDLKRKQIKDRRSKKEKE